MKSKDATELKWVRIFDPVHIPREYVEQIKERQFSTDKFFALQKSACVNEINGNLILNPFNLLFVLADGGNIVKGFCWMVVDQLSNALIINTFSIDKEYWGNGKAVQSLESKAKHLQEGAKLDRIYWITRCPKHSERHGFKRSKHVLMEYIGHGTDIHGEQCQAGGESRFDGSGTEKVS